MLLNMLCFGSCAIKIFYVAWMLELYFDALLLTVLAEQFYQKSNLCKPRILKS